MGRRSIAEAIFQKYLEEEPGEETWLIVYDFNEAKPTTKFYDNMTRITDLAEDGQLIQYSVYMTRDQRAAKALHDLVLHYEGQVSLFKARPVEL